VPSMKGGSTTLSVAVLMPNSQAAMTQPNTNSFWLYGQYYTLKRIGPRCSPLDEHSSIMIASVAYSMSALLWIVEKSDYDDPSEFAEALVVGLKKDRRLRNRLRQAART
jgi:hypothetical protein